MKFDSYILFTAEETQFYFQLEASNTQFLHGSASVDYELFIAAKKKCFISFVWEITTKLRRYIDWQRENRHFHQWKNVTDCDF